ncbi:MAG: histidine phosphatase family protein [Armatimonadota bacterium]|nr:histidine phosphatase family protein [Armatimonadota bacterium]
MNRTPAGPRPALYVLRHGETASNLVGRYAGRSDETLTLQGEAQAAQAGERLRALGIAAVYTSPIVRARQTAEIVARALGVPVRIEDGLAEMAMGPWEGLLEDEVAARYPVEFQLWRTRPSLLRLPGRESLVDVQTRARHAVQRIMRQAAGRPVAAVTHVALVRCLYLWARGLPLDDYPTVGVPNASIFVLAAASDGVTMVRLDEHDGPQAS